MSVMQGLRAYHAMLVVFVAAAFASGELGLIHAWLGYAVAIVLVARLLWAFSGAPQLGLMRFYPRFEGLNLKTAMTHPAISRTLLLGIAVCLVGATVTGIAMDRGRSVGFAAMPAATAVADGGRERKAVLASTKSHDKDKERDENEGLLSEVHELLANLLMAVVALHVTYLLLFKRPLASFMLFLGTPKR